MKNVEKNKKNKKFGQKINLSRNVKAIHLNEKDHKCDECGKSFRQKINLSIHGKTIHLNHKEMIRNSWNNETCKIYFINAI